MDKVDVNQIIRTVVVEGNLSLAQVEMLRVKVSKTKKQGEKIIYQYCFIGLLEPFEGVQNIENYRRRLGMQRAVINANGKI
ncbi:hypothetical protein H5410_004196 [Solanum commersonii]|uniref:Uncharacterized protein n=1 Tax=Solanum commersonii TaxID=4109 RepID=A0A9J6B7S6_SOLCO|nr:hypothetical protein H5410_004196 [Solanum commersonii]